MDETGNPVLPRHKVEQAVRLSYAQAMLGSIFAASTGGMFLIGYALKLGANNVQIGLLSTLPMLFVVVQLFSSMLVERGISRRKMTIVAGGLNVCGWGLVISLPYVFAHASANVRITALLALISFLTAFAYVSGNARSSWIGDLIPADTRGAFFGKMTMYAGIIGAIFAVVEGRLLDGLKLQGISAFNWLFVIGMFFGLLNIILFFPQADVPVARDEDNPGFLSMIRATFTNRPLMTVMVYTLVWSMQAIAAPFYATYLLRDMKMPFLGFGILSGLATVTMLISSSFWGRIVDRYGTRPVLIAGTLVAAPMPLIWIWLTDLRTIYTVIVPVNLIMGFVAAGVGVGLTTLLYKVTPNAGRSVQFAVYSVTILLLVSPMPTIGGYLPDWLKAIGIHADLRCTFYATTIILFGAVFAARAVKEPDSIGAVELVLSLPEHIMKPATLEPEE